MVLQYGRNMASHCNVTHPSTTILSRLCHGVGNHETLTWTWSLRAQVRVSKLRPPPPPSTSSLPRCRGWRMVDGPRYPCTSKQAAWARASPIKAMELENPTPVSGAESLTRKAGASVKVTLAISGLKGSTCKVCGLLSSYSSDDNLTLYACDVSEQSILRTTVYFSLRSEAMFLDLLLAASAKSLNNLLVLLPLTSAVWILKHLSCCLWLLVYAMSLNNLCL